MRALRELERASSSSRRLVKPTLATRYAVSLSYVMHTPHLVSKGSRFRALVSVLLVATSGLVFACSADSDDHGVPSSGSGGNSSDGGSSSGGFAGGFAGAGASHGDGGHGAIGQGGGGTGTGGDGGECSPDRLVQSGSCGDCPDHSSCGAEDSACCCNEGFAANGGVCADIDECALGADDCADDALCVNLAGGYRCDCDRGFEGSGVSCSDIDECGSPVTHSCVAPSGCTNTPGGYSCKCPAGQVGNGYFCKATDACAPNPCQNGGACINTPGGYACECAPGTSGKNCQDTSHCDEITFGDALLEQTVRALIGNSVSPVTAEQVADVTVLTVPSEQPCTEGDTSCSPRAAVTSLVGLECFPHLAELTVGDNAVSSLAPLQHLTSLRVLDLGCNPVADVSPLANLSELEALYLDHRVGTGPAFSCTDTQKLSSLAPLEDLIGLRVLHLGNQNLASLSSLSGLVRLRELDASDNQVAALAPLSKLLDLASLELSLNELAAAESANMTVLAHLPSLRDLRIDENNLENAGPLATASSLRILSLRNNAISDASPFATLRLQMLDLTGNAIEDVGPLAGLSELEDLFLTSNQITTLQPLVDAGGFGSQGRLWIGDNPLDCATEQSLFDELTQRGLTILGTCQ